LANLVIAFLIIVFAALVSYLAASSRKAPAVTAEGRTVLRMNRGYAILAGVGTALLGLVLVLALRRPGSQLPIVPTVAVIGAGTLALWAHLILATLRLRVEFDRELIRRHGAWGQVSQLRWEEVREVRFNKARLELSLLGASTRISLNKNMIGFPVFLQTMKERLDPALTRQAVMVIESLKGRL